MDVRAVSSVPNRRSAVQLGYMEDHFLHHFVKTPTRRPPIINRGIAAWQLACVSPNTSHSVSCNCALASTGYFARHYLIERLVQAFLDMTDGPVQLLTLGAGFDTRPFRYKVNVFALPMRAPGPCAHVAVRQHV